MATRRERHQRDWILTQLNNNPDVELILTGYLNLNSKSNWVTFTQIENSDGERISGHINFPKSKVVKLYPRFCDFNHKKFIINGLPTFYTSKGIKRGAIILNSLTIKA